MSLGRAPRTSRSRRSNNRRKFLPGRRRPASTRREGTPEPELRRRTRSGSAGPAQWSRRRSRCALQFHAPGHACAAVSKACHTRRIGDRIGHLHPETPCRRPNRDKRKLAGGYCSNLSLAAIMFLARVWRVVSGRPRPEARGAVAGAIAIVGYFCSNCDRRAHERDAGLG